MVFCTYFYFLFCTRQVRRPSTEHVTSDRQFRKPNQHKSGGGSRSHDGKSLLTSKLVMNDHALPDRFLSQDKPAYPVGNSSGVRVISSMSCHATPI